MTAVTPGTHGVMNLHQLARPTSQLPSCLFRTPSFAAQKNGGLTHLENLKVKDPP